jgi:hypothetical protein
MQYMQHDGLVFAGSFSTSVVNSIYLCIFIDVGCVKLSVGGFGMIALLQGMEPL